LRDDLKFTEVAAATIRSLQELRLLQRQQAVQGQFFSPIVLDALTGADWERALAPREADVSVLFCDLRGFSRESEKSAGDLLGLLGRVSKALGVTTHHMLLAGGVVGDFQGDAVMGFWGWPIAADDAIGKACSAALAIRAELVHAAGQAGDPLAGFSLGIGLATGRAVAGKIGTVDQVKVTVFGPVVNLASRLESMTKLLRAPILLDETSARYVREQIPRTVARVRRLAVVQPLGINQRVEVSELLPPENEFPALTDAHLAQYEVALEAAAFSLLHGVPASDRAKDFLTVYIAQHNRQAPEGWQGVIKLESK
jgi:adenylate cyclase